MTRHSGVYNYCYHVKSFSSLCFFFKCRLIFMRVMKVFHEPLGESNTERRVKISVCVSKEGTQ